MMLGREKELEYLNTAYEKAGSRMIVVYGRRGVGKTTLLKAFFEDKDVFYYQARETDTYRQLVLLVNTFEAYGIDIGSLATGYDSFWEKLPVLTGQKKVLVLENFEQMVKGDTSFMPSLITFMQNLQQRGILILLCSSDIDFVENDLVAHIGKAALAISGFLKVRELKFSDLRCYFPNYSAEECVIVYSILGGVPRFWNCFDKTLTAKENICRYILSQGCVLREEGMRPVREQFREPAVYEAILSALSQGYCKLNDLYHITGFSRAKISVYLKNLIAIEAVTKVFSFDTPDRENQKKGIYRISNHFMRFWFRYLYPNASMLELLPAEEFYDTMIAPTLRSFCREGFAEICREMMLYEIQTTSPYMRHGLYEGKNGNIDFVGQIDDDAFIAAFSDFDKTVITQMDWQHYLFALQSAKLSPEQVYLFSGGGFDEEMMLTARTDKRLILIGMKDL